MEGLAVHNRMCLAALHVNRLWIALLCGWKFGCLTAHTCCMQELQQEVARRQMAVLGRSPASQEAPQSLHERQAGLR